MPTLPFQFQADVEVTEPFVGTQPGTMYYDWTGQRQRLDITSPFGGTNTQLDLYGIATEYDASCEMGQCRCQSKALPNPMSPMQLPPFATWVQNVTVNSTNLEVWACDFAGTNLTWYIDADTHPKSPVATAFLVDMPMVGTISFNFTNYTIGALPDSTFDPTAFGCPAPPPPAGFNVSGYVIDAQLGTPIFDVSVTIQGDGTSQSTKTGVDGSYTFTNLQAGEYTLTARLTLWNPSTKKVNVTASIPSGTTADLVLCAPVPLFGFRFVLTWGPYPRDLDAHFLLPGGCNVGPANPDCINVGLNCTAMLDRDVTNGYGPDTITVFWPRSGTYRQYVVISSDDGTYPTSDATLTVYSSAGLAGQLTVPLSGYPSSNKFWMTYNIVNGGLVSVNLVQATGP